MFRCSPTAIFVALAMLSSGMSASAETLRCQSVNGNLNCAGSNGVSCQTVNGKKVCVSGHGDVVQSFGNSGSSGGDVTTDDEGVDDWPSDPAIHQRLEQRGPGGRTLMLERNGTELHLRTDRLSIDRN
jgi:hypothetical protein